MCQEHATHQEESPLGAANQDFMTLLYSAGEARLSRRVYFGIHCYDSAPSRIVATELRRDVSQDLYHLQCWNAIRQRCPGESPTSARDPIRHEWTYSFSPKRPTATRELVDQSLSQNSKSNENWI